MTDPKYHQYAHKIRVEFDSDAVFVISFSRWGIPTLAVSYHPEMTDVDIISKMERVKKSILDLLGM